PARRHGGPAPVLAGLAARVREGRDGPARDQARPVRDDLCALERRALGQELMEGYGFPFISGDSHLETHPKHWVDRVPAKHRDRAPRVVRLPGGTDAWLVEGAPVRPIS